MQTTLLVLAAGMGSRYGGLKQIDPVGPNGETIIDYSIHDAIRAGFSKVVFVIRKDIEDEFRQSIGSRFEGVIPVEYAFQDLADLPVGFSVPGSRVKPWGTGHAIMAARDLINEPFAAINADDFYGRTAYQLLRTHLNSATDADCADYAMVGFVLGKTLSDNGSVSRGVCECDKDGFVSRLVERTRIFRDGDDARIVEDDGSETRVAGGSLVSMNFWGFTPSIFDHLDSEFRVFLSEHGTEPKSEFLIPTVTGTLVTRGQARLTMLESPDPWFGITYQEDKPVVTENIRKLVDAGVYPERLFP
jgi:NDP-sugar pyrophosphorylase family protein